MTQNPRETYPRWRQRPKTFLLRLWRRPEGCRAQLIKLETGEERLFKSLDELVAFLKIQALSPVPAQEEA